MRYSCSACKATTSHKPRHFNAEKEGKLVVLECTVCKRWSFTCHECDWQDFKERQRELAR